MVESVSTRPVLGVQFLRFIAASGVLVAHSMTEMGIDRVGSFGVDIFFVITGFVILISTESNGPRFLQRRIARLVPLAWVGLVAYAAVMGADSWNQLIAGFLFLTDWHPQGHVFSLYWTLTIEMGFALIFAVAMMISHQWRAAIASAALVLCISAGFNPILIEFVFGMAAGYAYLHGIRIPQAWIPAAVMITGMIVVQAALDPDMTHRWLVYGIPAAVMVLAMASIPDRYFAHTAWLGDISYSIYIWHLFAIGAVSRIAGVETHPLVFVAAVLALTIPASWVSYRVIEVPSRLWISGFRLRKPLGSRVNNCSRYS